MVTKIKIVTDSTADLPKCYAEEHDIHVVPLYVNFPHQTYRDGVDLQPSQFYPMLEQSKDNLPKTSTPTRNDFINTYKSLLEQGYEIISLHLSSGLSSTISVAESAAQSLKGKIHVFDTKSISIGISLQILETAKMIKQNFSTERIISCLHDIRERTEVLFSLDTLEYLAKGGRIGKVSALLGTILNIKPIVKVENGIYMPLDKVRNQKQALKKMAEHMKKILGDNLPSQVGIAHGMAEEAAQELKELIRELLNINVSLIKEVGPVIGVHTGPGTIGLAFTY